MRHATFYYLTLPQFIAMNAISFIYLFLSVNLRPQKCLWQFGQEGGSRQDGVLLARQYGPGERGNFSRITHFTQVVVHEI